MLKTFIAIKNKFIIVPNSFFFITTTQTDFLSVVVNRINSHRSGARRASDVVRKRIGNPEQVYPVPRLKAVKRSRIVPAVRVNTASAEY